MHLLLKILLQAVSCAHDRETEVHRREVRIAVDAERSRTGEFVVVSRVARAGVRRFNGHSPSL